MDLADKISELISRKERRTTFVMTAQATKRAFVLSLLQVSGYDTFSPMKGGPTFTASQLYRYFSFPGYCVLHKNPRTVS